MQHTVTQFTYWVVRLLNFWISLIGLASITIFVWYFDQIDYLSAKIFLNTASVVVSAAFLSDGFSSGPERHKLSWPGVWVAAISAGGLLILIGDRADLPGLVLNVGSLIASLPALWVYWTLAEGKILLRLWVIPIIMTALLFWVTLIAPTGSDLDLLFVALPIISYLCVAWGLLARFSLACAERQKKHAVWGPATESLTMLLLVVPLVVLAMLAVYALQVDDIWVAMSGVIIGILFGSTVSTPLRKFLLALTDLSLNGRCEGGAESD